MRSAVGGRPTPSDESSEVMWVPCEDLDGYPMDRTSSNCAAVYSRTDLLGIWMFLLTACGF
jgi:hypothetical protein